jgi:hypothetical protein
LFSRFCLPALWCAANKALHRVRHTRSLCVYAEAIQVQAIMLYAGLAPSTTPLGSSLSQR